MDGLVPMCMQTACPLPTLGPDERRIMDIRQDIIELRDLVPPHEVLRHHGATMQDARHIAAIEREVQSWQK